MGFRIAFLLTLATLLVAETGMAFPLTSAQPWKTGYSIQFTPGFNFDAVVALPNCSASFVRFKSSRNTDPGLVLTNGHCAGGMFGGMLKPGEIYYNKARTFSMTLLDKNANKIGSLRSEKIIYATMTDTDITLMELTQTYDQIQKATGVQPLTLADQEAPAGVAIEIPSGYWKRTYACQLEAVIPTLKEGDWVFKKSVRYTEKGCEVIGGTSGSPIVSVQTGEVIAINNTGNESGQRCTVNNPCEIDKDGNVSIIKGRGYGQQTHNLYTCLNARGSFDLATPGCALPQGH